MVHIIVFALVVNLIVVLILLFHEQALVAVSVVGSPWRRAHVIRITLICSSTRRKHFFGVGVKAPEG